jgi:general secretion pathway protein M
MSRRPQREVLLFALTVLIVLAVMLWAGANLITRHHAARDRIEQIEPRYARLLGLEKSGDALKQVQESGKAQLARQIYPANQEPSQAGNDAQQRLREIFTSAGLNILSTQVLPAKQEKNLDRIPLSVRTEGDLAALQAALTGLHGLSPGIFLQDLTIQANNGRSPDGQQRMAVQFSLFVVRARTS